jgi:hypothetical protein
MPERARHPLCIGPAFDTARGSQRDMIDRQAARILELEGQVANERGRLHDANNKLTSLQCAIGMIAMLLGLNADTSPPEVLAAATRRLK